MVINESNTASKLGKLDRVVSRFTGDKVYLDKSNKAWVLVFNGESIEVLSAYIDIMREIM